MNHRGHIVIALILSGAVCTITTALIWAMLHMSQRDFYWLGAGSFCLAVALFMRDIARALRTRPVVTSPILRAGKPAVLILRLADSGAITNGRPMCPPRHKLNHQRS